MEVALVFSNVFRPYKLDRREKTRHKFNQNRADAIYHLDTDTRIKSSAAKRSKIVTFLQSKVFRCNPRYEL